MVMPVKTVSMPKLLTALVKWFVFDDYNFDQVTLTNAGGTDEQLVIGTVLGKITATGKFVPLAHGAVDGSQNFAGFLAANVTVAAGTDVVSLNLARGAAVIDSTGIVWPAGADATDKANALAAAASAGFKVE